MLITIKIIISLVLLTGISFLLGSLVIKDGDSPIAQRIYTGFFVMLSIFLITSLPCVFLGLSMTVFTIVNAVIFVCLCAFSVMRFVKEKRFISKPLIDVKNIWFWVAIALIVFETLFAGIGMHIDNDDSFYVATAVTSVETDSLFKFSPYTGDPYEAFPARYVLSAFPLFGAFFGKLLFYNPTIFFHSVLPFFIIPLAYSICLDMGKQLFSYDEDKKRAWLFVAALALINMFSYFSTWSYGIRLLLRPWQGKTLMAALVVPFIFMMYLKKYRNGGFEKNDRYMLLISLLAGCYVSSMGIFLPAVVIGILALITLFTEKSFKSFCLELVIVVPNLLLAVTYLFIR